MKNVAIKEEITKYSIFNTTLIYQKETNIFQDDKQILWDIESFGCNNEFAFFHKYEDQVLISIQLKKTGEYINHKFPINPEICFGNYAILKLNYNRTLKTHDFYKYDLEEQILKATYDVVKTSIHHHLSFPFVFFKSLSWNIIGSFHLPSETTLWQYSVADLGASKVSKIMGVFGQVLLVVAEVPRPVDTGVGELYIGLDIKTGAVLWTTDSFTNADGQLAYFSSFKFNWQFLPDSTSIQALMGYDYVQLDTQTGSILQHQDLRAEAKRINARFFQSNDMQGHHLYFRAVDEAVGGFASMIGAYNIYTHRVDWHHNMHEQIVNGALRNNQPKVAGNKVYAHDTDNTLHIFELEEGEMG
jgi:hypothetical protein